ncbi:hypothetical protein AB1Y20_003583 [Prymnesium parvum]|uniref:Uncharacterized protein n=1 Tax=Prymnesium parvum TaxID=97485 RepID=A0AB34J550_PRYPA
MEASAMRQFASLAPTPRGRSGAPADRRLVEAHALATLLAAPPTPADASLHPPRLMESRELPLAAHDELMLRCEWLEELVGAAPPPPAMSDDEVRETRAQHEKWLSFAEARLKRDAAEHAETFVRLEAEARAFREEMEQLKACATVEAVEALRRQHEAASPHVELREIAEQRILPAKLLASPAQPPPNRVTLNL